MADETYRADDLRKANTHRMTELEKMIAAEDDPTKRGNLIVLSSINNSLVAHTELVLEMNAQLTGHLKKYEARSTTDSAIINQAKGMWRVVAVLLLLGQGVAGYGWFTLTTEWTSLSTSVSSLDRRMERHELLLPMEKEAIGKATSPPTWKAVP